MNAALVAPDVAHAPAPLWGCVLLGVNGNSVSRHRGCTARLIDSAKYSKGANDEAKHDVPIGAFDISVDGVERVQPDREEGGGARDGERARTSRRNGNGCPRG